MALPATTSPPVPKPSHVRLAGVSQIIARRIAEGGPDGTRIEQIREAVVEAGGNPASIYVNLSRGTDKLWRRIDDGLYGPISGYVRPSPFSLGLRFHGLKIAYLTSEGGRESFRLTLARITSQLQAPWVHRPHEGMITLPDVWEGREVTWTGFPRVGRLDCWLKATMRPLHPVLDFPPFASYVYGTSRLDPHVWRIEEVGVNADYSHERVTVPVRFQFPEGMSLAGFNSMWAQVYEKAALESTRADVHLAVPGGQGPSVGDWIDRIRAIASEVEVHFARDREGARP